MTVAAEVPNSQLSELTNRIDALLSDRRTMAQWWVQLVASLDELSAKVGSVRHDLAGRRALAEQIRLDAPHLYSRLRKLDAEQEVLEEDLVKARILAGESAGNDSRYAEVAREVKDCLRRLRRLESRSNDVVLDAYDRDIGGE